MTSKVSTLLLSFVLASATYANAGTSNGKDIRLDFEVTQNGKTVANPSIVTESGSPASVKMESESQTIDLQVTPKFVSGGVEIEIKLNGEKSKVITPFGQKATLSKAGAKNAFSVVATQIKK